MSDQGKAIVGSGSYGRIEQIVDEGKTEKGKLVGSSGRLEDAAALMWDTEMKRLGLEPYQGDAEWNKLVDSKGNRLYGTQKSMMGGLWMRWKKPTQSKIDESSDPDDLKASLAQNVSVAERSSKYIWNHPAIADLFLDGLLSKSSSRAPPGLVSFTSSVILAVHVLEDMATGAQSPEEKVIFSKVAKAYSDLLATTSLIPGESTLETINSALASAEKMLRQGAAIAGVAPQIPTVTPVFAGREEDFLRLIERVVSRIKALQEGDLLLLPCGWLREAGDSQMLVRRGVRRRRTRRTRTGLSRRAAHTRKRCRQPL